jgi:CMP-N,N'-diacetyllegionaminic acid synthase
MSDIIGLITARGGSKGVPRKNVKLLAGKPLIAWTIQAALQSQRLSRVIVSTDNTEIAQISKQWGAEVPFMRPPELAQDDTPHILVVEHVIQWLQKHDNTQPDYIMLLQPTSPLRSTEDIGATIQMAEACHAVAVVSVSAMDSHPYLAKQILEDGTLADFVASDISYLRRQDLPPAYALNGAIYLNRCESLLRDRTFLPPGTCGYIMPPERSLDIDTPWDFYLAELVLKDKYGHETI